MQAWNRLPWYLTNQFERTTLVCNRVACHSDLSCKHTRLVCRHTCNLICVCVCVVTCLCAQTHTCIRCLGERFKKKTVANLVVKLANSALASFCILSRTILLWKRQAGQVIGFYLRPTCLMHGRLRWSWILNLGSRILNLAMLKF